MFPPFPTPGFVPNFTGYDLDQQNYNWYEIYETTAQTPHEALIMVSSVITPLQSCLCKFVSPF